MNGKHPSLGVFVAPESKNQSSSSAIKAPTQALMTSSARSSRWSLKVSSPPKISTKISTGASKITSVRRSDYGCSRCTTRSCRASCDRRCRRNCIGLSASRALPSGVQTRAASACWRFYELPQVFLH